MSVDGAKVPGCACVSFCQGENRYSHVYVEYPAFSKVAKRRNKTHNVFKKETTAYAVYRAVVAHTGQGKCPGRESLACEQPVQTSNLVQQSEAAE